MKTNIEHSVASVAVSSHIPMSILRRPPLQHRSLMRVISILDAAELLLTEMTPEKLQVLDIAREANVTVGTLYHFFKDKQAILACLVGRTTNELKFVISSAPEDVRSTSVGLLRWYFQQSVQVAKRRRVPFRLYNEFGHTQDLEKLDSEASEMFVSRLMSAVMSENASLSEREAKIGCEVIDKAMIAALNNLANLERGPAAQAHRKAWEQMLVEYLHILLAK